MEGFKKIGSTVPDEKWDDRQSLIDGWDADAIRNATVLVIGAGAIGNETLKNLALLGFGHVIVCDMDRIELTNLTRTVLFSQEDIGKEKSALATQKYLKMNLEPTASADSIECDIVYELGDGVFRRADIVLGCLDNVETRMYTNKLCMRYDIPYIDAGIGSLGSSLIIMNGHKSGCYQCFAPDYKYEKRFREPCNITMKKAASANKAATVQTASAIVSGIQVQEALKAVCNMNPEFGVEIHYQGTINQFNKFKMKIDDNCWCHSLDSRKSVMSTPISADNTLRELLEYTCRLGFEQIEMNYFEDYLRGFVSYTECPCCRQKVRVFQPMFKLFSDEYFCQDCKDSNKAKPSLIDTTQIGTYSYSLTETPSEILDLPLKSLGIPYFHVLPVKNTKTEEIAYFELTKDIVKVLPSYAKKHSVERDYT